MKLTTTTSTVLLSLLPTALGQGQLVLFDNNGCIASGQCINGADAFYTAVTTDFCYTLQTQGSGVVQTSTDPKSAFCGNSFDPGDGHSHQLQNCQTYYNENGVMVFSSADWFIDGSKYGHCGNSGYTYGDFLCTIAGGLGYVHEFISGQCFPG